MTAARFRSRRIIRLIASIVLALTIGAMMFPVQIWTVLAGDPDLGDVRFDSLERPESPNTYLVCPSEHCPGTSPDAVPGVYKMAPSALYRSALEKWSSQPRVTVAMDDASEMRARFIQRTAWLKFPDTISLQVFPSGENSSTLAVYSRSQIGYGDFGANKKRVVHWLSLLR